MDFFLNNDTREYCIDIMSIQYFFRYTFDMKRTECGEFSDSVLCHSICIPLISRYVLWVVVATEFAS